MTISSTLARNDYTGSTSVGPYVYGFKITAATDLQVIKRSVAGVETALTYLTDYTVAGAGNDAGGSITLISAPLSTDVLSIRRAFPITQPASIRNQGSYLPETIEDQLDRAVLIQQQQEDAIARSLKLPPSYNPSGRARHLIPTAGYVVVGDGTGFTTAVVDRTGVTLPGNGRATTTLSALLANNAEYNVDDYGTSVGSGSDDTAAFAAAIAAAPAGSRVIGGTGKTYLIGTLAAITKPLTLDFSRSRLRPTTTGIVFTYSPSAPDTHADSFHLLANFIQGTAIPSDLVKLANTAINPRLDIAVQGQAATATVTHAVVWNYAGYGLRGRIKARNLAAPAVVYLSHSDSDPLIFSNDIDLDLDISNNGGCGVTVEGCVGATLRGVVEGCTSGGIQHTSAAFANRLRVDGVYCESNTGFDVSLASGDYILAGNRFMSSGNPDHVLMGAGSKIVSQGNTFYKGGFAGVAPVSLVDTGSEQRLTVAGYTGRVGVDALIKDTIRGGIKFLCLSPQGRMPQTDIAAGVNTDVVTAQPLGGTAYDEWRIVSSYNLPAGIREIFRVFVSRQDTAIIGVVVTDLQERENLVLDVAPGGTGWGVGDTITGATSTITAEIVAKTDSTHYAIKNRTGKFTLGEILSNGVNAADQGASFPTTLTASGTPHSAVTVVDTTDDYKINISNTGSITMHYWVTYVGNTRLLP